ncbi:MAG: sigma-70 family RNA polymerase sigma factor [Flavisolibacter sp.]|nr:sigma-70 family RNA polymerase sigma factor [Flavisolibacter sp.]
MKSTKAKTVELKDEQVVDQVLKGNKKEYEQLMRRYDQRLYRISMSIINDKAEALDIMQTTYLNAYSRLSSFKGEGSFGTWLTRILINESLRQKKKKMREQKLKVAANEAQQTTPLKTLINKELKTLLETAIANLPEKYKLVFVMREMECMSVKETMDVLKLTETNVKVRLNRAKEMLRENLGGKKFNELFKLDRPLCNKIVDYVLKKISNK